ncbi:RimK/LysX family protein [Synechocystis sp. LKSZ1]|uniref:ATP-dependent zinc protease family protein n=1 Tax=Synechocystis sp. LKSZ1 TaxID=3144951 RepID=UPI00336BD639
MISSLPSPLPLIGWREWVAFPQLGVPWIKAKIDTGARSSALHAVDLHTWEHHGQAYICFKVYAQQRSRREMVEAVATLQGYRRVRSSNGHQERRPVITTLVTLGDISWPIEVTLTNREAMGFRLLLGRQAISQRFWTDPSRSFLYGQHPPSHLSQPSVFIHENSDSLSPSQPLLYPSPQGGRRKTRP